MKEWKLGVRGTINAAKEYNKLKLQNMINW